MERKGYKSFFISQLKSPKTRVQLVSAFIKKYPKDTKTMIAEEKAQKETNRYLHYFKTENLLSDKPVKGSTHHQKLFFLTATNAKTASEINLLRTAGTINPTGKSSPKKSTRKPTSKKSLPKKAAKKKAISKAGKAINNAKNGIKKIKKFF